MSEPEFEKLSQQEIFAKLRDLKTTGTPEIQLIAEAVSVFVDQFSRLANDVVKVRNELQRLKSEFATRKGR